MMAQLHLHARRELVEVEGLGEVVVGTQAQQVDLVRRRGAGRDHDDGRRRVARTDEPDELLPCRARQHEVADDDVKAEVLLAQQQARLGAGEGLRHRVAVAREPRGHHVVDRRVVLYDQHPRHDPPKMIRRECPFVS